MTLARPASIAIALLLGAGPALAQMVETPSPQGGARELAMPPAAEPPTPAPVPWLPKDVAVLQALDKLEARAVELSARVGQSVQFGQLTIAVRACMVRPPDQPQDATALLQITDQRPGAPGFTGWMLMSDPGISMLESPLYDVRVLGCR